MARRHNGSIPSVDRRRILQTIGAAGTASVAGCFSSEGSGISFPLEVRLEVVADDTDRRETVGAIAQAMENTGYFEVEIEEHEWDTFQGRIFEDDYHERGYLPFLSLSGTFDPGSFAGPLHKTTNRGQCCNLNGLGNNDLDESIDDARFGPEVAADPELRGERYDEIWRELAAYRGSSVVTYTTEQYVRSRDVHGYEPYPFSESSLEYALHSPADEVVTWIDRENQASADSDWREYEHGGTLQYSVDGNIGSFDPPYSTDTLSTLAQSLIFEKLVTLDAEGNVYPWLARSYDVRDSQEISREDYAEYMRSVPATDDGVLEFEEPPVQEIMVHPDDDRVADEEVRVLTPEGAAEAVDDGVYGMQFRYELHEGVRFHDGEELTARNVVETVERYENSDMSAQTFDSVLHAREADTYTVDIYAQVPDAAAHRELPAFDVHATSQTALGPDGIDPLEADEEPIGTGPYEFETFEDGGYFVATKFDDYWLEKKGLDALEWYDGPEEFPPGPVIETVDIDIVASDPTRAAALQAGDIDVAYGLASSRIDEFDTHGEFLVDSVQTGGYVFFQYPVQVEPWDDPRLRRAVNHLVPRAQIVEEVLDGWGEPAWTMVPSVARGAGTTDYEALEDNLRPENEFDPERAVGLIEELIEDRGYDSSV